MVQGDLSEGADDEGKEVEALHQHPEEGAAMQVAEQRHLHLAHPLHRQRHVVFMQTRLHNCINTQRHTRAQTRTHANTNTNINSHIFT